MAGLSRTGGKTAKVRARKERKSAKASPNGNRRRIGGRETEVARLKRALREAQEQQTAAAEVLQVINSSPGDLAPVFDAILRKAHSLCGVTHGSLQLYDGVKFRAVAVHGLSEAFADRLRQGFSFGPNTPSRGLLEGARFVQIHDHRAIDDPMSRAAFELGGIRTALFIPLRKDGILLGRISASRQEVKPFTEKEIGLLESFAAQAVIAIENARLLNETKETLERQTATADILKVIASSPDDVQPVFEAIVNSATRLFEPCAATITTLKDGKLHWNATATSLRGFSGAGARAIYPIPFDPDRSPSSRAMLERRVIEFPDTDAPNVPEFTRRAAATGGFRSVTFVPLVDRDQGIGTIIFTQPTAGFRFSEKQLALVQTFADQAVIAIQNARLFNETKEALERQTATAEVLRVIASSPSDLKPVFEAIATRSTQLVGGHSAAVSIFVGDMVHLGAFTPVSPEADAALKALYPRKLADYPRFELARYGEVAQVSDYETETRVPSAAKATARARGYRSVLFVPMNSDRGPIGVVTVTRKEPGTFAAHHIQLLQTFADQAVIAIENTRLFDEVQAKTRDLEESLQQQTATADVLKVISRSAFDLRTVLDALLGSACRLCEADIGTMRYREGSDYRLAATFGFKPEWIDHFSRYSTKPDRGSIFGRTIVDGRTTHIPDVLVDPEWQRQSAQKLMGIRAALGVPLVRDGQTFGVISLFRLVAGSFSEKQIELVETFADQAVIAISNVHLFDEVQAKTHDLEESLQQQTATSQVLQIISSSPSDLAPVFEKILENATRVCGAEFGSMNLVEGDSLRQAALYNAPAAFAAARANRVFRPHPEGPMAAAIRTKKAVQIADVRTTAAYAPNTVLSWPNLAVPARLSLCRCCGKTR